MGRIQLKEFSDVLSKKLSSKVGIIDVRSDEEYRRKHIAGARSIPIDTLESHIDELKGYDEIYLYCRRGSRAQMAFEILSQLGMTKLNYVVGNIDDWEEEGLPIKHGEEIDEMGI